MFVVFFSWWLVKYHDALATAAVNSGVIVTNSTIK